MQFSGLMGQSHSPEAFPVLAGFATAWNWLAPVTGRLYSEIEVASARASPLREGRAATYDRSYDQAYSKGLEHSRAAGRKVGASAGRVEGIRRGSERGVEAGREAGLEAGYPDGTVAGRQAGFEEATQTYAKWCLTCRCATRRRHIE
jgi:flagellar biosynthesis/type III secretory pathway protein FliH